MNSQKQTNMPETHNLPSCYALIARDKPLVSKEAWKLQHSKKQANRTNIIPITKGQEIQHPKKKVKLSAAAWMETGPEERGTCMNLFSHPIIISYNQQRDGQDNHKIKSSWW